MKKRKIFSIFCLFFIITVKQLFPQAGQLDTTFGQKGAVINEINFIKQGSYPGAMAIQNDGRIVVAGLLANKSKFNFVVARYNMNGNLDNTFGINGKVILPIGNSGSGAYSVAIQNDDKIVASGYSYTGDYSYFTTVRFNPDGNLDQSFGTNGIVITAVTNFSSFIRSVIIQNDGKILVGGGSANDMFGNDRDFALVRYNSDGSLDNSFGSNGKITIPISSKTDYITSLGIQIDGRIIAVGESYLNDLDFAVVRYNSNGSLDNSFGVNGKITTQMGETDIPRTLSVQTDGKIVIGGYSGSGGKYDFAIVRYNSDGSLDNTFGTSGKVITPFGDSGNTVYSIKLLNNGGIEAIGYSSADFKCNLTVVHYHSDGSLDSAFGTSGIMNIATEYTSEIQPPVEYSVVKQDDGKLVTFGKTYDGINYNFTLNRFNTNGNLDKTFGVSGSTLTKFGVSKYYLSSVVIQSNQADEKIVTAGHSWNGNNFDFALSRYNSNGSIDNTFGINGNITTSIGDSDAFANSAAVQSDGKIVVTGSSIDGIKKVFTTVRYNIDGSLDNTFGTGGKVITPFSSEDSYANSVIVQKDGKILAAGLSPTSFGLNTSTHSFTIVRYNADGSMDADFGTNGIVIKRFGASLSEITSLGIQEDDKIIAAGFSSGLGGGKAFVMTRFNPDGKIDTTFSHIGIVTTSVGKVEGLNFVSSISAINSVSTQNDGKIIACGYCSNGESGVDIAKDFALVRYNTDGSLDSTFGDSGIVMTSLGDLDDVAYSLTIQDDGKIIAGGFTDSGIDEDYAIVRYTIDGSLDSTFGINGIAINNFGAAGNVIKSILLQNDGNIIAAGYSANSDSSNVVSVVARYLGNNQTTSFAENRIKEIPSSFNLFQNYPNPFNPNTKIRYTIPSVGTSLMKFVQLKIYDILGREVTTLVNENQQPGNYEVTFNTTNLSSGVYLYKLTAGSFSATKKMILLK